MANIRILPEQLANRIAAGEVVERPASVVKELVENSLDAGADRIDIEVEGGGTRLVRVLDNGSGMDEDDILLSFERHGTSKIHDSHDLVAISTLGFRGEAIPSIASVSKMTVTSRPSNKELGTTVFFDHGRLQKVHETGCSQGTLIEVRNLFGKTPARKKFLRTQRTELGHIDEIIKNYALACPNISFTLLVNGKETIRLTAGIGLEDRLRSVMHYADQLIPVESDSTSPLRSLHGFLLPPERSVGASARLRLFINGRAIKDRVMSHAAFEGLRGFLLKGHTPGGYLHLRIPTDELDVNVHPAKQEVRFRSSGDIHQFIKQSVESAIRRHQDTVKSSYFTNRQLGADQAESAVQTEDADISKKDTTIRQQQPLQDFPGDPQTDGHASPNRPTAPITPSTIPPLHQTSEPPAHGHLLHDTPPPPAHGTAVHTEKLAPQASTPAAEQPTAAPTHSFVPGKGSDSRPTCHNLQIIGQFKNLYIFCRAGDNLLVIDQHAAHERILYEKLRKQYTSARVASQNLLFPETVELSPFQIELVESNSEELARMGFTVAEFGGNSYVLSAVPALAGQGTARDIFFDVLEGFGSEGDKHSHGGKLENILATMACKAAVKSGDTLSLQEIDALLNTMAQADLFSHCPHGRPVLRYFSEDDIKKWFHRT
ncbi:MAG: DNA mismatch repair endonuclease MutL [Desulfopila sp.]